MVTDTRPNIVLATDRGEVVRSRLPLVPAAFFGMVIGIAGLGNCWRAADAVWDVPRGIGEALNFIAIAVWIVLLGLYLAKWIWAREQAIAEAVHPVACCFIGLAGVATMLAALGLLPYVPTLAVIMYILGAAFTVLFAIWRTGSLWQGGRDITTTTAVLYLPSVAGSFVTATVASALGYPDWGQLAFGAGFFSWLAIESVLLNRLLNAPALAEGLRTSLGIQLAPPAVGCVAYLSMTKGIPDVLVHAMLGYSILQALLLLRLLPWIMKQPFSGSYWAFTFGLTALATAPLRMISRGEIGAVADIAPYLFVIANLLVGAIAVGTVWLLIRGRLIPVASPATLKPVLK